MNADRVETPVEADSDLHLTELPCRRGDLIDSAVGIICVRT
jgi:hypothetical protein